MFEPLTDEDYWNDDMKADGETWETPDPSLRYPRFTPYFASRLYEQSKHPRYFRESELDKAVRLANEGGEE